MTGWEVLLAGALVGAGVTVIAAGLVPTQPDLAAVLARLDRSAAQEPAGREAGAIARMRGRALPRVIEALGLRRFAAELAVTEQTVESARQVVLRDRWCSSGVSSRRKTIEPRLRRATCPSIPVWGSSGRRHRRNATSVSMQPTRSRRACLLSALTRWRGNS